MLDREYSSKDFAGLVDRISFYKTFLYKRSRNTYVLDADEVYVIIMNSDTNSIFIAIPHQDIMYSYKFICGQSFGMLKKIMKNKLKSQK